MNISQSMRQRLSAQSTPANTPGPPSPEQGRCKLVQGSGSRPRYSSELQGHLRTRLRQAALIFGGAAVVVLFFNLVTRPPAFAADPLSRVLHVAAVVVPLLVAGVVSGPWLLSLRTLRWIELALFTPP